jgi:CRP-like cAMP-binding protein
MPPAAASSPRSNLLLELLPETVGRQLREAGKAVPLELGIEVAAPAEPIEHVYFPTSGYLSLLSPAGSAAVLEVGLIGFEGMFGASLLLGVDDSPVTALVQGAGKALRLKAGDFLRIAARSPALDSVARKYLYVHLTQLCQTAACNRSHSVNARMARWLMMTQDRASSSTFVMTHEFMAHMLGVRRAGVTEAAQRLKDKGIIRYARGAVTVLDRKRLDDAACGCYDELRQTYVHALAQERAGRRR